MANNSLKTKSVSLILPVYNEVMLLENAVSLCLNALSKSFSDFEIILVDDGSYDGTGELMDKLAQNNQRIKVLHNYVNLNIGVSIQRGMLYANYDYVTYNAVDLPLDPDDMIKHIQSMNDSDIMVLQRNSFSGYEKWRVFTSLSNRLLVKIFFPISSKGIYDFNFTQIFRKHIVKIIIPLAKSPTTTTSEMIIRAKCLKLNIETVIVDYKPRISGKGAFGKPHDILWSLYDLIRFRLNLWNNKSKILNRNN